MKYVFASAAAALAMTAGAPAFAAVCTIGTCSVEDSSGGALDPLGFDNSIAIQDENVEIALGSAAAYNAAGQYEIAGNVTNSAGIADISFSQIIPPASQVAAGFYDLTIEFFQGATSLGAFALTDANGVTLTQSFLLSYVSDDIVDFTIDGTVFRNFGASLPDYNINIAAVPLPAAAPLLLAGLAGLGFSMRRRRVSQ